MHQTRFQVSGSTDAIRIRFFRFFFFLFFFEKGSYFFIAEVLGQWVRRTDRKDDVEESSSLNRNKNG